MNGLCITNAARQFGITSKTLRYYERIGLLKSNRIENNYRFYSESEVERLKQILILRKMQISMKDIIKIYENDDMSMVVEVFVNRINSIDEEVHALTELKRITNEFLQTMLANGIKKISALPLIYDEMDKKLSALNAKKTISMAELDNVGRQLAKPVSLGITTLPSMRVLSSVRKDTNVSDIDAFWGYVQRRNIPIGLPGQHELFEYQTDGQTVIIQKVADDFENDSIFIDLVFPGGLFAISGVYLDEDIGERLREIIKDFDSNKYYQINYQHSSIHHGAMLENLISPDGQRELVSLLVPVKKRIADNKLFDSPVEISGISVSELDAANQALWAVDVPLDKLTPIKPSGGYIRYETLPTGEALFSTYVGSRYLSTNIEVKLPFRVDVEFKFDVSSTNADEGFRVHFGNCMFAVNERNNPDPVLSKHAIIFNQPIFGDIYTLHNRGEVKKGEYNHVSWIIGEEYLAVIINDEVRYCTKNMPYMNTQFQLLPVYPILINGGGNTAITMRKITVSQLETKIKTKIKNGEFIMMTKQSNNQVPGIQTYCVGERGENFAFDGACEQLMKCLGENDFGYWLISGIAGNCFTQVYPKNHVFYSDRYCVADYHILYDDNCAAYIEGIFDKLGYACTYVPKEKIMSNKEIYRQTLMAYIDKGIPVIDFEGNYSLICGYEEHGNVFMHRYPCNDNLDKFHLDESYFSNNEMNGWIFVGERREHKNLSDIYREAVLRMPETLTTETDKYYFGAAAFRAWADDIENGFYDGKTQDEIDLWGTHTSFVCAFETIAAKSGVFLSKALELNRDFGFISEIIPILSRQGAYANGGLEDLGGGFNITLAVLQDIDRRKLIANRLRLFANNMDKIVQILQRNLCKQ